MKKGEIEDIKHIKLLYRGWKRSVTDKIAKARQTGAGAQDETTLSDEMMYSLIKKNTSLRAIFKVTQTFSLLIYIPYAFSSYVDQLQRCRCKPAGGSTTPPSRWGATLNFGCLRRIFGQTT